jgi:hypothetical protein
MNSLTVPYLVAATPQHRTATWKDRATLWTVTVIVLWGVASFGAVYDWGRMPLLLGSGIAGFALLVWTSRREWTAIGVGAGILSAIAVQVLPLPAGLVTALSSSASVASRYQVGAAPTASMSLLSVAPGETITVVLQLAALLLLSLGLSSWLRSTRDSVSAFARNASVIAAAIAIEAIVQQGTFNGKIYWFWTADGGTWGTNNYFGPFVNRNHFAGWMILASALAAGRLAAQAAVAGARVKPGWRNRILWLSTHEAGGLMLTACALLIMLVSLVWTMSRSGIAGCAVALLVVTLAAAARTTGGARRLFVPLVIVALLGAGVASKGAGTLTSWYATTDTLQWRFNQWHDAMALLRDFWVTGSGLGTYGILTLIYPQTDITVHAAQAHNDYLQLAVEGGLLVGIPVLIAIAALVRTIVKRLRTPQDERTWWIRLGAVAGIAGIAVQEITDFSLQIPGVAVLFAVVVAIAIHEPAPVSQKRDRLSRA